MESTERITSSEAPSFCSQASKERAHADQAHGHEVSPALAHAQA